MSLAERAIVLSKRANIQHFAHHAATAVATRGKVRQAPSVLPPMPAVYPSGCRTVSKPATGRPLSALVWVFN